MNTTTVLEPTHVLFAYEQVDPRLTEADDIHVSQVTEDGVTQTEITKAPKLAVAARGFLDRLPSYPEAVTDEVGWRENWTIHLPGYDYEIVGWIQNPTLDWVLERIDKEN